MRVLISLVMVVLMAGFAFAKMPITDMVDMDLNMRPRLIVDNRDFNADTGWIDDGDLRTMIGISVMPNENVLVRVRMRESRGLGDQASLGGAAAVFEAQEAYAKLKGIFDRPMSFAVGRFEYELGRGRIIGATDWSTFGPRTFDGVHIGFNPNFGHIGLAVLRTVEKGATDYNLVVLSGCFLDGAFKPLFIADLDNEDYGAEDLNRIYTMGFFYHRGIGESLKVVLDAAYQMGTVADIDLGSYMVAADVYYKFSGRLNPFIGVGVDMTSGNEKDAVLADDGDAAFYAPLYTTHAFRGWMDYFTGTLDSGLTDIVFHVGFKPKDGMKVVVNAHMFSLTNARDNADGDEFNALGNEIDVKVVIPANENMKFECGYGMFMPTDDFVPDGDTSSWGYLSSIITF